jgi:stage VI sporulation protein D
MANRPDSKLRFTIEESVWLRNGQEVADIFSMSLNPEITIEESNEQVLIKGYLYLNGEYRPATNTEGEEDLDSQSLKNQLQFRSMDQINEVADGVLELVHRFPVDITIPKQRIANVDELYVNIESFDYDLPSKNCIELTADVEITGLLQETDQLQNDNSIEEEAEFTNDSTEDMLPEMVEANYEQRTFEEFEFEARRAPETVEEESVNSVSENDYALNRNKPPVVEMKSREPERDLNNPEDTEQEKYRYDYEDSFISPLKSLSSNSDDDIEEQSNSNSYTDNSEQNDEAETIAVESNASSENDERPIREENALYLTSILSREEEEFSRLKMCIIQPGESLDEVAARYEISTSHLVRVNRLDNEEVNEGQILYIPIHAGRV